MTKQNNARRHFAIRAAIARKAANDNITIGGRVIAVTDDNRQLVDFIRELDAERAYEGAAFGRAERPRIAA